MPEAIQVKHPFRGCDGTVNPSRKPEDPLALYLGTKNQQLAYLYHLVITIEPDRRWVPRSNGSPDPHVEAPVNASGSPRRRSFGPYGFLGHPPADRRPNRVLRDYLSLLAIMENWSVWRGHSCPRKSQYRAHPPLQPSEFPYVRRKGFSSRSSPIVVVGP